MSDTVENVGTDNAEITLQLADIQNAVKVIDFAADQGAFKGWKTIEQVLVVRQRLNAFIEHAAANQPADAEAEVETTPEA